MTRETAESPELHKSIEWIAEYNSALIDKLILKRERTAGLKFVAGKFSIKWSGTKCTMTTELYFKDQADQWKKEEIACDRPLDIFTKRIPLSRTIFRDVTTYL